MKPKKIKPLGRTTYHALMLINKRLEVLEAKTDALLKLVSVVWK